LSVLVASLHSLRPDGQPLLLPAAEDAAARSVSRLGWRLANIPDVTEKALALFAGIFARAGTE